jgi:hypothetical protein
MVDIYDIAAAFARASKTAGQSCQVEEPQPVEVRAANLIRCEYIRAGDPHEWSSSGEPIATIYCEQRGGDDDCAPPADYYASWPTLDLPDYCWGWVNAAVAQVWPR